MSDRDGIAQIPQLRTGSSAGRWVLAATVLGSAMVMLDGTVVNVALPTIGRHLHASLGGLQWTVTAYTLALAGLILLGGSLGDRLGRRKVFLIGVVWFALASALCGLAPNIGVLIGARVLQGIGGALLTPGSLAIIQATFAPEDRPRAVGAWSGLGGVASAVGPILGGWLVQTAGWRWVFLLNLPLAAAVVAVTVRHVPETRDDAARGGFDVRGAVLAALALAGITYGLIEAPEPSQHGCRHRGGARLASRLQSAFVVIERRRTRAPEKVPPMLPLDVFASRQFTAINIITFLVYGAFGGLLFLLVLQLQVVSGFSPLKAGSALLPVTVLMLLLSARSGSLAQRFGPRWLMTAGIAGTAIGMALMGRIGPGAELRRRRPSCGGCLRLRPGPDSRTAHCDRAGQRGCPARGGSQRRQQCRGQGCGSGGRRCAPGGGRPRCGELPPASPFQSRIRSGDGNLRSDTADRRGARGDPGRQQCAASGRRGRHRPLRRPLTAPSARRRSCRRRLAVSPGRQLSRPRVKVGLGEVSGSRCSSLSRRIAVPVARNSVACSPQTWFFTSTVTPTMPDD